MTHMEPRITIQDLTMAYGTFVIQRDLSFTIPAGEIAARVPCYDISSASCTPPKAMCSMTERVFGRQPQTSASA